MPPILREAVISISRVRFSPKLLSVLAVEIAKMTTVFDDNMVNDYILSANRPMDSCRCHRQRHSF